MEKDSSVDPILHGKVAQGILLLEVGEAEG